MYTYELTDILLLLKNLKNPDPSFPVNYFHFFLFFKHHAGQEKPWN